eukprot:Awhi_evm1s2730
MDFSQNLHDNLIWTSQAFSISDFGVLCNETVLLLVDKKEESYFLETSSLKHLNDANLKRSFGTLATFFIELCHQDVSLNKISTYLKELGIGNDYCRIIYETFQENQEKFVGLLGQCVSNIPVLRGIDWNLDFVVK